MVLLLARLISFLSNPFFILIPLPYLLVYKQTQNSFEAILWTIFSLIFMIAIGLFVLYFVRKGVFTDFDVSRREQRPLLFFFASILSVAYLVGLMILNGPPILYAGVLGIFLAIIVLSLINTKIKASIHVATVSSLIMVISIIYGGIHLASIALIPIIAWSRVKTKRHSLQEAIIGCITGIVLTIAMYFLIKSL